VFNLLGVNFTDRYEHCKHYCITVSTFTRRRFASDGAQQHRWTTVNRKADHGWSTSARCIVPSWTSNISWTSNHVFIKRGWAPSGGSYLHKFQTQSVTLSWLQMLFLQTLHLKPDAKPRITNVYSKSPEAVVRMKKELDIISRVWIRNRGFIHLVRIKLWNQKWNRGIPHRHNFCNLNSQLVPVAFHPQGCGTGAQAIMDGGVGAWNLCSGSTDIFC